MYHVRHGMIFPLGVPCRDETELIHEIHEFGNVCLCFQIPDRGRMASRLIGSVDDGRNHGRRHGLQFLRSHQTRRILRPNDVHRHPNVRTGMQNLAFGYPDGVFIKYFFDCSESLSLMGNLFGRSKYRLQFNPQGGGGKTLQLLAKNDGIGSARSDEFDLLRCQSGRNILQFLLSIIQFFLLRIDRKNRPGRHGVGLLEHRIAFVVKNRLPVGIKFSYPIFQIQSNPSGHSHGRLKDGGDSVCPGNDRGDVYERNVEGWMAGLSKARRY